MDAAFIRDLFASFRPVVIKRMFGGAGLYADGAMFGLVFDGVIYLKAGDPNITDFKREGCGPFTYTRGKPRAPQAVMCCRIGGCPSGCTTIPMSLRFGPNGHWR